MKGDRKHADDLRGLGKLAIDATKGVTDVVQAVHGAIGGAPARLFSAPIYATIRGVTSLVGGAIDIALAQLTELLGETAAGPQRAAVLAVLNGVLGDYLAQTQNALAIEMRLRPADPAAPPTPRLLVLVHGSSMDPNAWKTARDLGCSLVHLHYNSGLHVSTNGRAFDAELEKLVAEWPVPVERIDIVAHSMGGLVARSACHYAEEAKHGWRDKLRAMIFVATPHHGAALERGGNWLETLLGVTRYSAPFASLAKIRSAGVTDLRFGNVIDEHWVGRDRFAAGPDVRTPVPLPQGVACYAIATDDDALVPRASAMGEHANPALTLGIPASHTLVVKGPSHIGLLGSTEVWDRVEQWLANPGR